MNKQLRSSFITSLTRRKMGGALIPALKGRATVTATLRVALHLQPYFLAVAMSFVILVRFSVSARLIISPSFLTIDLIKFTLRGGACLLASSTRRNVMSLMSSQ